MNQYRNTPFTARSVIASLLLGTRPPRLPGAALVRAAGALGCAEGTTRVALSRMAAAGELVAADGWYALAGPLAARQARQEEGRHPILRPWDGTWVIVIVGGRGARSSGERAGSRRRLIDLRLVEWREGVWVRPDNLTAARPDLDDGAWVTGAHLEPPLHLWDLEGWAATADALRADMREVGAALGRDERLLAPAFSLAASAVRHLRDDPLLPDSLLPRRWPGVGLRAEYDAFETRFRDALRPVLAGP